MKKWFKIILGVIGGIVLLLGTDLLCIFTINRPLFAIKKGNESMYKGIFYDTYYCKELSMPQIKQTSSLSLLIFSSLFLNSLKASMITP